MIAKLKIFLGAVFSYRKRFFLNRAHTTFFFLIHYPLNVFACEILAKILVTGFSMKKLFFFWNISVSPFFARKRYVNCKTLNREIWSHLGYKFLSAGSSTTLYPRLPSVMQAFKKAAEMLTFCCIFISNHNLSCTARMVVILTVWTLLSVIC